MLGHGKDVVVREKLNGVLAKETNATQRGHPVNPNREMKETTHVIYVDE